MSELKIDNKLVTAISIGGKNIKTITIGGKLFSFVQPDDSFVPIEVRRPNQGLKDNLMVNYDIYSEIQTSETLWMFVYTSFKFLPITDGTPATHILKLSGTLTSEIDSSIPAIEIPDIPLTVGTKIEFSNLGVTFLVESDDVGLPKIHWVIDETAKKFPRLDGFYIDGVVPV